jgi:hypothetical protein
MNDAEATTVGERVHADGKAMKRLLPALPRE